MKSSIKIKAIFFFIIFSNLCISVFSQDPDTISIDAYLKYIEKNDKAMGSVTISKGNKIIYHKNIGYQDYKNDIKASEGTKYRVASITKLFTAVLVMKAVEEGKLSLDEKLSRYFPKIKNAEKITIEHMLRHSSGIYNFSDLESFIEMGTRSIPKNEMLEIFYGFESDFEPGTQISYSNTAYYLLALILEKKYDKEYNSLLTEVVLNPLKLSNTYNADLIDISKNEAKGYEFKEKWIEIKEMNNSFAVGLGDLTSTGADLITFIEKLHENTIISRATLDKMLEFVDYRGLGFMEMPFYQYKGYGHTGLLDSFHSLLIHFPEQNMTIAVLLNALNDSLQNIHVSILKGMFSKKIEIPKIKEQ